MQRLGKVRIPLRIPPVEMIDLVATPRGADFLISQA
jgi:hypothetical protein